MPEYLAPGVYVEETSFRAKSIEGVSTSTTAFAGATLRGPVFDPDNPASPPPELITSFGDFERVYGGIDDLVWDGERRLNHVAHAALAYFTNGGSRLFVSRAFQPTDEDATGRAVSAPFVGGAGAAAEQALFRARFPGTGGNGAVILRQRATPTSAATLARTPLNSVIRARDTGEDPDEDLFLVRTAEGLRDAEGEAPAADALEGRELAVITVSAEAIPGGRDAEQKSVVYDELGLVAGHRRFIGDILTAEPTRRRDQLENLYAIELGEDVTAFGLLAAIPEGDAGLRVALAGGDDGIEPNAEAYRIALEPIGGNEEISIVAAPGHSEYEDFAGIQARLIAHGDAARSYRIVVLDTPPAQLPGEAQAVRARIDSTHAALYYPWVVVSNPLASAADDTIAKEIALPPSGFVCGIYARNDVERGVYKAPANEVVRGALRFELEVNAAQQAILNPLGVNCLRYFAGRGNRVWGARTATSDPEWKYVNVRRYFNYLERSIDRGTQWAVFEPNGERLWANVRQTVSDFLFNEWASGALLGSSAKEAFFVRCDRSTMTQNDLDNGRLVCLIGVAALKPAEFVIFRIGQKTADARQ